MAGPLLLSAGAPKVRVLLQYRGSPLLAKLSPHPTSGFWLMAKFLMSATPEGPVDVLQVCLRPL